MAAFAEPPFNWRLIAALAANALLWGVLAVWILAITPWLA